MSTTSTPEKAKALFFCDYSEIAVGILQIGSIRLRKDKLVFSTSFSTPQQCWGLTKIGFVFSYPAGRNIDINSFHIRICAILPHRQIGFVFSNWFFNNPQIESWGLNNIGFVFRRPKLPKIIKIAINLYYY